MSPSIIRLFKLLLSVIIIRDKITRCSLSSFQTLADFIVVLAIALSMCVSRETAAEEVHIPGSSNITSLEDYLCSGLRTIEPNTILVIDERQSVPGGEFCIVENTTNITIIGAVAGVTVECLYNTSTQEGRGFGFFNVSGLHIKKIDFMNCGALISSSAARYINASTDFHYLGYRQKTVFLLNHCIDVQLSNVIISSYYGFALIGVNLCGNTVLANVEQHNSSSRIVSCSKTDYSASGSGTYLYYIDSPISNMCQKGINLLVANIVSKSNKNQCPYLNVQSDLNNNFQIPVSGGSTLGLTHAQTNFAVVAQLDLVVLGNDDAITIGSSVILFASFHTDSSITLSGLYQNNRGILIATYFQSFGRNTTLLPKYSPLILKDLSFIENNFPLYSVYIMDLQALSSGYTASINNVIWKGNNRPQLLYVDSSDTSRDRGIQIEIENVSCVENNQNTLPTTSGAFKFISIRNISMLSNTYISGDFVGSCIQVASSNIYLSGHNLTFTKGRATFGGALQLDDYNSFLYLVEPVKVVFSNNTAKSGSAIYAADTFRPEVLADNLPLCTLQLVTNSPYTIQNITQVNISVEFSMTNGDSLSVNAMSLNTLCNSLSQLNGRDNYGKNSLLGTTNLNRHIFSFENDTDAKLSFSNGFCYSYSAAEQNINCTWMDRGLTSSSNHTFTSPVIGSISTHPGKKFLTVFYAYEAYYIIRELSSQSYWRLRTNNEVLPNGVIKQSLSVSLLNTLVLPEGTTEFNLYQLPSPFRSPEHNTVQLARVQVLQCPPGFTLQGSQTNECDCIKLLTQSGLTCDANTGAIDNPTGTTSWIGYKNGTVYFSRECLPNRCDGNLQVDLSIPDYSCLNHRSGQICGQCAPGYSVIFGSDVCQVCSNAWILTIFLYGLAGIFFVFILFALNLTVSTGTICGLVIYSNILNLTVHRVLADVDGIYPIFLRVFISFLNLDIGFPLCFYDGMTASVKYGMQFVFPLYLWLLVIILIVACKYSMRLANKLGFACVQVLATLLFFSYSKILSNVYSIFTFQTVNLQIGNSSEIESFAVWFPDGQRYAEGSHITLIFFAITFTVLLLLPFTIVLTFAFYLLRFRIVNRFLPFIDAYSGPFEKKFRFWFGVRLWVIVFLFFLDTVLVNYSFSAVFFSHSIVVGGLIVIQAFLKPFRCSVCRLLDLFYLMNYWLITVTYIYLPSPDDEYARTAVVTCLVSCAFVAFIGILVYQLLQVTKKTKFQKVIRAKIKLRMQRNQGIDERYNPLGQVDRTSTRSSEGSSISKKTHVVYDPRHFRDSIFDSVNLT